MSCILTDSALMIISCNGINGTSIVSTTMILIVTVIFKVLLLCMFSLYTVLETSFRGEYISDMSLLFGTGAGIAQWLERRTRD